MKVWQRRFLAQLARAPLGLDDPDSLAVRRWRARLRRKGFVVDATGAFDQPLENATVVAQIAAGVKPDGLVGPVTWAAVGKLRRLRRPLKPAALWKPKVIDSRPGTNGYPKHPTKKWRRRKRSDILLKIGHFTGNAIPFVNDARFHVQSDYLDEGGAPAIAYTVGVNKAGEIEVFNDWRDVTWSCRYNTPTLNVVFQGGFEGPNAHQRKALEWLYRELEAATFKPFPSEPAWPVMPLRDSTHMHVTPTACPGAKGEAFYRGIAVVFDTTPRS